MSLFPIIQPRAAESAANRGLYVEAAWDFDRGVPIYKNGSPVLVCGAGAVAVWAWNALATPRFEHEIFTWDYGNDAGALIGKPFTDEMKQSEAARSVRECLMTNPYITGVKDISVGFEGGRLGISCVVETVYGEVGVSV